MPGPARARTIEGVSQDADRRHLRVSDADRAEVAERLRIALDEGRLDITDYDERVRSAYAATTYGELEPLTADLPPPAPPAVKETAAVDRRKWVEEWREWAGGAIIMITIWGVVSLVSGSLHMFWPAIPLAIWAAVIVGRDREEEGERRLAAVTAWPRRGRAARGRRGPACPARPGRR